VNMVAPHNSTYYDQFTTQDYELFDKRRGQLEEEYMEAKVKGDKVSSYNEFLSGAPFRLHALRPRLNDSRPYIPYTATCFPGYRIAVSVGGELNLCERVNGTNPVGHLKEGYNYSRARELIREYQEKAMHHCSTCPVARSGCSLCFSFSETRGGFALPADWCRKTREDMRKRLSDYITMLESNPNLEEVFSMEGLWAAEDRAFIQS
jgi:uncharacterized protein